MASPHQILLKEDMGEYGIFLIRRGATGSGYFAEGHCAGRKINKDVPMFCFPIDQDFVAEEFKKQNKEWRWE